MGLFEDFALDKIFGSDKIQETLFGSDPDVPFLPITQSRLTPAQQQAEGTLSEMLQRMSGGTAGVAAQSPLQALSLSGLENFIQQQMQPGGAFGGGPTATTTTTRSPEATAAINQILAGGGDTGFEQFFKASVADPLTESFVEETLPQISRSFATSGLFSGDRERTEAQATESLVEALAGERAKLAPQFRQQEIANQLAAAGLAPTTTATTDMMTALQGLMGGAQAGAAARAGEQADITRQQQYEQQQINNLLNFLGLQTQDTAILEQQGTPGIAGDLAGGLMQMLPLLLMA
jgi:hypothetical protein